MNTAVINVKVEPSLKSQAQNIASKMGVSLSTVLKGYLHEFIRTKSVTFHAPEEIPSAYMKRALKQAEKEISEGYVSPRFDNAKDAIAWLDNPKKKYVRDLR